MPNEDNDLLSDAKTPLPDQVDNITTTGTTVTTTTTDDTLLADLIKDETLKNSETAKKFKDVDSIVKSYDELQKKLGARVEDLSAEDLKSLNKKFNVPESLEGYEFEDIGENKTISDLRELIHKAGISKTQGDDFDKILRENIASEIKDEDYTNKLSLEESRSKLESHFGLAYKDKVSLAKEALYEIADSDQISYFKDKGFTSDPEFIKALAKVGEIIGEDKLEFKSKTREFNMEPTDIISEISKMTKEYGIGVIMKDPDLKKKFVHLHGLKAQLKGLQG